MERKRQVVNKIAEQDSADRFHSMSVEILLGQAKFQNANELQIGDKRTLSKKIVITTSSTSPRTVRGSIHHKCWGLQLDSLSKSLAIRGDGSNYLEFAQIFMRFQTQVTVIEMFPQLLPREDAEAVEIVQRSLVKKGIRFILKLKVFQAKKDESGKTIVIE